MSIRPLGDNRFQVRVYNPHGREYRRVVVGRRAAQQHEVDMKSKLASGRLLDPHGGKVTFREYAAQQIAARDLRPSTRERYERTLAQHVDPVFGHRPLRGIRHTDVLAFQSATARRYSEHHARDIVALLRSILRAAALDGIIERSPAAGIRLGSVRPSERVLPSWEQVRAAADAALPETALAIRLLACTGLRASEVCGLDVTDVRALRRELAVERQLLRGKDGFYVEEPKTPESRRIVPIPADLVDALAGHLAQPWPPVLGHRLVLGRGKPVAGDSLANRVSYAARKVGASFAPHDLRHLYTTELLEAGIPLRTVDAVTGHRSYGMTLGVYAHVTPESLDRVRETVAAAWHGAPAAQRDARAR